MLVLFALLLGVQAAAASPSDTPTEAEAAVIANCAAHKFETVVQTTVAGKPHASKVKLCGKVGQTKADWLRTLNDALDKVAANERMATDAKEQIVAALKMEIARVSPVGDVSPAQSNSIPSLPAAPMLGGPDRSTPISNPSGGGPVEYSVLPPMPAPKPAESAVLIAAAPSLPAPRMTFRCVATTSLSSEGPCDLLERDTLLTVRADEDLPGGTSLRFLRRGDDRGEIELPVLRSGQTHRFTLPPKLCAGVAGSRVEIQIVRAAKGTTQVVDTRGPYELRC